MTTPGVLKPSHLDEQKDPITNKTSEVIFSKWKGNTLTKIKSNNDWLPFINGYLTTWGQDDAKHRGFNADNHAKAPLLEAMLEYIGQYTPGSIHRRITRESTWLQEIWEFCREYAGLQNWATTSKCTSLSEILTGMTTRCPSPTTTMR